MDYTPHHTRPSNEQIKSSFITNLQPHSQDLDNIQATFTRIKAGLDTSFQRCDSCGHKTYNRWEEALLWDQLDKLEKRMRLLRAGGK